MNKDLLINNGWGFLLEIIEGYTVKQFLRQLQTISFTPSIEDVFKPFMTTRYNYIQLIIIGQSPYPINATGHAFESTIVTPTLKAIFSGIKHDYPDYQIPESGDLSKWVKQDILLLNSSLTIGTGPFSQISHFCAWESFMATLLKKISSRGGIAFMLWGRSANQLLKYILKKNNHIISTSFPTLQNITPGQFKGVNDFLGGCIDW